MGNIWKEIEVQEYRGKEKPMKKLMIAMTVVFAVQPKSDDDSH